MSETDLSSIIEDLTKTISALESALHGDFFTADERQILDAHLADLKALQGNAILREQWENPER